MSTRHKLSQNQMAMFPGIAVPMNDAFPRSRVEDPFFFRCVQCGELKVLCGNNLVCPVHTDRVYPFTHPQAIAFRLQYPDVLEVDEL
jgi:hypothetical protein